MNRFDKNNLLRGISYLKRNGLMPSIYKALERLSRDEDESGYDEFMKSNKPSCEELLRQKSVAFDYNPKVSILVPLYETDITYLRQTLDSVAAQSYGNWELCLADASKNDSRRSVVRDFCEDMSISCKDSFGSIYDKVKYNYLEANEGISGNTNKALDMATGDFVALLDHDDLLEPNALYEFVSVINNHRLDYEDANSEYARVLVVYSDEDKVNSEGNSYFDYHKKPDFDPVMLCTNNYICHLLFVDINLARSVGGFHKEYDGAQDHDFVLRCTEGINMNSVVHIPKVLYHWRSTISSTAENPNAKLYAYEAGKRAVKDYLKRVGIKASVADTEHLGFYKVVYDDMLTVSVKIIDANDFEGMNDADFDKIDEEFILIKSKTIVPVNKEYVYGLCNCMQHDFVGAVTGRIIKKNGKLESAGYDLTGEGELVARFEDLNRHFSGYLHRANIEQLVGGFSKDIVLIRKSAVEAYVPFIKLKDDYKIYYNPYEEFKRKTI